MICSICEEEMEAFEDLFEATNDEMTDGFYLDIYFCENCGIIVRTNKREFL